MCDAVKNNDVEAIRNYYQVNPDFVDAEDDGGYTLLMEAAKAGHMEIVQCLVELSANINAYCERIDHYSDERGTPLAFALENFHRDIAMYLIQKGADAETEYRYQEEESPFSEPSVRNTCFMYAMDSADIEMLELMLEHDLNLNGFNAYLPGSDEETTPLFYAVAEAKTDMVKWLLEHGADPHPLIKLPDMGELNAIMFAVHLGLSKKHKAVDRYEIVELLLKAGVDLTGTYDALDGETVPELVINSGDERFIQLFGLQGFRKQGFAS